MAILPHRQAIGSAIPTRLLYSSRSYEEVIYREEEVAWSPEQRPLTWVCGPTPSYSIAIGLDQF